MANDMLQIRWHGRGGQGAKTAAGMVAEVAVLAGKNAQGAHCVGFVATYPAQDKDGFPHPQAGHFKPCSRQARWCHKRPTCNSKPPPFRSKRLT